MPSARIYYFSLACYGSANRIRSERNFSRSEVNYLLVLVDAKKHVLECKKTDRTSSEEKAKGRSDVEAEFNGKFGIVFRNAKVLRTKYENLKKTEHDIKIKKQEMEIVIMKKEHDLKVIKMELEIDLLKLQIQQMEKKSLGDCNNISV
ncbi:PREDICTED: uncharacterized protein LOC108360363 [Rhagoletis zephyria]|uniref:uncharacterized protein LOC108360363 n=1 Tax=Rhagoletis zephyria TaxID=28612 RepID=UPI0008118B98|nr:PREDICTED: uncharacterized protein LOC108360363 [Rhagoletis zephyria]